jgi:hypothetical protein
VYGALTAMAANDRNCFDELHVLTSADDTDRLAAVLLKPGTAAALADRCRRLGIAKTDILFGRRTIHAIGGAATPDRIADDALNILRTLCEDARNEVTVVASSDAGALGILAHAALQLVGRLADRFFVLDVRAPAGDGSGPRPNRDGRGARPALLAVETILADRPAPPNQSYHDLAAARRLLRRRLSQPGLIVLNGKRRVVRIDDVELSLPRLQFFWLYCLATLAPQALPLRELSANVAVDADGRIAVASRHPQQANLEALVRHLKRVFVTLFPEAAEEFPFVFKRACGPAPGLPSAIAKLNGHFKRALGPGAEPYLIAGGRGAGGYRLTLPPAQIKLVPHIRAGPQTAQQRVGG